MAIRAAIAKSRLSGTRNWILPEYVQGPQWPLNPVEPESSWPMFATLTPNHFVMRYDWSDPELLGGPQPLLRLRAGAPLEEVEVRWYEEPFYAVHYWRGDFNPPELPEPDLEQLTREAFTAVRKDSEPPPAPAWPESFSTLATRVFVTVTRETDPGPDPQAQTWNALLAQAFVATLELDYP